MTASEKLLGVRDLAEAVGVSEATAFRWAAGKGAPAGFPPPIRRPGKAATWPQSAIDEWLRTFDAVRSVEMAMEAFGSALEVDALLQKVARYGRRLLSDTSVPLGLRKSLADMLSKVRWDRADGTKLTGKDRMRAARLLLELMAIVGPTEGSDS